MTSSEVQERVQDAAQTESVQVPQAWVVDTNIVLDLWLFEDPATIPLRAALQSGAISHLATDSMR